MIRWLVIALFIYLIYRLVTGPKRQQRRHPLFTFRFNNSAGRDPDPGDRHEKKRGPQLDQIEEAEFEDITENDIKEKKSDK
ncbi:MAG: hypothetical protein WEC12_03340 [Balneolaceae bacterium]